MCRRGSQEFWRSEEPGSGSGDQSSTLGALCWSRAAWSSVAVVQARSVVAQVETEPAQANAGLALSWSRQRVKPGMVDSPSKKLEIQQDRCSRGTADMEEQGDIGEPGDPGLRGPLHATQIASRVDEESSQMYKGVPSIQVSRAVALPAGSLGQRAPEDSASAHDLALEDTDGAIKDELGAHKADIQALKDSELALQSKLEKLENSSGRNNLRVLHVPKGAEGDNLRAFLVSLMKSALLLEESEKEITRDIQRVHRDPFRKNPSNSKPRKILINFLTYGLKEKNISKALKLKTIKAQDFSFEIRSDLSRITINRQWELGQRLEEFEMLGASAQLKFPATLRVMFNNKMYNVRDGKAADELLAVIKSGDRSEK
ncbi:hypothetical protein NDU88_006397 [Pleurodeles waltl]|uniref:L1 transposable element RRM domain-containing protein n=1 Tax=Pleurodeles waltl TaxID=8319 RepID=A0AAV7TDB7_PLEWA|nr:hypothetical protein NDU88_006397 [Pleurodeles waltl]